MYDRADAENIAGQLSRRLAAERGPIVDAKIDDVKAAIVKRLPAPQALERLSKALDVLEKAVYKALKGFNRP